MHLYAKFDVVKFIQSFSNTIPKLLDTSCRALLKVTISMYLLMAEQASPISSFPLLPRRETMLGTSQQPLQHLLFPRAVVGHRLQVQHISFLLLILDSQLDRQPDTGILYPNYLVLPVNLNMVTQL